MVGVVWKRDLLEAAADRLASTAAGMLLTAISLAGTRAVRSQVAL